MVEPDVLERWFAVASPLAAFALDPPAPLLLVAEAADAERVALSVADDFGVAADLSALFPEPDTLAASCREPPAGAGLLSAPWLVLAAASDLPTDAALLPAPDCSPESPARLF